MWHPGIITCFLVTTVLLSGNATGGDPVVVELQSGQRLRAQAIERDPLSSARAILTVGNEQIRIRRQVSWKQVVRLAAPRDMLTDLQVPANITVVDATANPRRRELNLSLAPDQAAKNTAQVRSFFQFAPPPPVPDLSPDEAPVELPVELPFVIAWPGPRGIIPAACVLDQPRIIRDPGVVVGIRNAAPSAPPLSWPVSAVVEELPPPRELVVTARAFNRNGLADWNSLEVLIQGRTAAGQPCRVRGSLKCSLWVRRAGLVRVYGDLYFEEPRDVFQLGQWSQFLDGSETDANGVQKVVLALPPRSPDQNQTLGDFGLLTVDLDIPGQGRLATSSPPVPLRQAGPIRNRSTVDFGSPFLPSESVSEGISGGGNWPAPLSNQRPDLRRYNVQP